MHSLNPTATDNTKKQPREKAGKRTRTSVFLHPRRLGYKPVDEAQKKKQNGKAISMISPNNLQAYEPS